jgi:transcriptional regulator of acetoin/glycerol metabolism
MVSLQSHYARIHEVVQSPAICSRMPSHIADSWIRCSSEHKLDPVLPSEIYIVDHQELLARQERFAAVMRAARLEIAMLYQQIARSDYAIMLTDMDGILLNHFCEPGFLPTASRAGLTRGAVWSERYQGTNGMGTCLMEQRPILIQQGDHYLFRNTGLTCAAAPIFDWHGKILAVLDASSEARDAPPHILDLVRMSAKEIENQIFIDEFRHCRLLSFHSRLEFVGTLHRGIIAIDADERMLAASPNAITQLGVAADDLAGQAFDAFFSPPLHGLVERNPKSAMPLSTVFSTSDGRRFFAAMAAGANVAAPAALPSRPDAPRSAALRESASSRPAVNGPCPPGQLLCGQDAAMANSFQKAMRLFERDVPIMLYGETGTGKELFAKSLHLSSSRANQPYVAINCAAIPEHLAESELFGYKPGAFTGASKDGHPGKVFQANGGTLFLDEIGDMPIALQTRLLRVLEEREVVPLGGRNPIKIDIRLISATHCDLQTLIARHEFRDDLFYRIQGLAVTLPALRERADKCELIKRVLEQEAPEGAGITIDESLMGILESHAWPGNIRQLRNVLRVMVALRHGDVLNPACLPDGFMPAAAHAAPQAETAVAGLAFNPIQQAEREALLHELERLHWNLSKLSRQLKISRNTLYRKMERLDIHPPAKPT